VNCVGIPQGGSLTYPHFFYGAGAAANVVRCVHG